MQSKILYPTLISLCCMETLIGFSFRDVPSTWFSKLQSMSVSDYVTVDSLREDMHGSGRAAAIGGGCFGDNFFVLVCGYTGADSIVFRFTLGRKELHELISYQNSS